MISSTTGILSVVAPSAASTNTLYLRETYSGDYSMTIDHIVTVQVSTPNSSSESCIGLNIDSEVGCGFALTGIFLAVLVALIGVGFWICYQCYLKKWFLTKRLLKEIKNCPPVGDEREGAIVENENGIGEQIT